MEYLYVSRKVERTMDDLRQSGSHGASLVRKVVDIIEGIRSGRARSWVDVAGMCTRYGENRIKNCRKYDLSSGHRLITIQRDGDIYIPFLGNHDACQRWVEKNSSFHEDVFGEASIYAIEPDLDEGFDQVAQAALPDDFQEDDFVPELSDKELRMVFRGLVEGT